jgi:hypothetical protein
VTRAGVLAAAAALEHFTVAEAAAYCEEDTTAVAATLAGVRGVEPEAGTEAGEVGSRRWRVTDPGALHRAIAAAGGDGPTLRRVRATGSTRLMLAEDTLLDCAHEESAEERRLMAATAANHLRQYVAGLLRSPTPWWDVEVSDADTLGDVHTEAGTVTVSRLHLDFALARLTDSEAVGGTVALDWLVGTAVHLTRLAEPVDEDRARALFHRFTDLAVATITAADLSPAPERLLFALAWRRARALGEHDVRAAAEALVTLLRDVDTEPPATHADGGRGLYRVLGELPDGREHVAVYADLLELLPRQYAYDPVELAVPGALVHTVADRDAAAHLQECAATLELDLTRSPFRSDSALIGLTAHVFQDLAFKASLLDDSVRPRSERMRMELLSLADVAV